MKLIADFHIHSHYSRATSKQLNFENLHKWAQLKGLQVVGTGDITHPGWLDEMREKLEPAEEGLFKLKDEYAKALDADVFKACRQPVRFILSGEISNIYKKNDKTRKNHNVVFLPTFEAVEKFQTSLEKIGNIRSDGRPILGLDAHDLLELVLETDQQAYLVPAHIWTPWFSLFGSKSGFDTIEECFEELTPHIFALETGLSSDPPMNWRLSALDRYTLISDSDAHSPHKLAREANLFDTELSYPAIFSALKQETEETFLGTIEFFPQEGKYHHDGHRKCGISWTPKTTIEHNGICPVCGKKVTVGVSHRVEVLADREDGEKPETAKPFYSLIPLPEILAEAYNVGATSKRVMQGYEYLLTQLGAELAILQDIPLEEIEHVGGGLLSEGIRRMREGKVIAEAGYDGEYGVIRLFDKQEKQDLTTQLGFFGAAESKEKPKKKKKQAPKVAEKAGRDAYLPQPTPPPSQEGNSATGEDREFPSWEGQGVGSELSLLSGLNPQQQEAVLCTDLALIIVAGPGTGKTRTLTHRIAYLLSEKAVPPEQILAITFTNKAAEEMKSRLEKLVGKVVAEQLVIKTFHAFCTMMLRAEGGNFTICSEHDRKALFKSLFPDFKDKEVNLYLEEISTAKNQLLTADILCSHRVSDQNAANVATTSELPNFVEVYRKYEAALREYHVLDFDDLILCAVQLFETQPEILDKYRQRFRWISVDEYQDLNFAQYRLLKLLKTPDVNLCVIGDPDQAIYGFRGANREYFLRFQEDFPDAKTLHLKQNYRSTQMILEASKQVIAKNPDRKALDIWSECVSQTKLETYQAPTCKVEAEYIVHEIEKMVGGTTLFSLDSGRVESHAEGTYSFGDFAVLYRLSAQSQPLFEAFQRSGIPYQIIGQTSLYEHKEIREILACLWLLYNPESQLFAELIAPHNAQFDLFVNPLRDSFHETPVTGLIQRLIDMLFSDVSDEKSEERFKKLLARAAPFETRLGDFLEMTVLHKETDEYDPRADRVTLMTLHASKGLEFPVVCIVGCEETLIPYQREGKAFDLEEERRLFYVGMTRAQQKLVLTHAQKRFVFGQTVQLEPSRFLNDIEEALKEIQVRQRKAKKDKKAQPQMSLL